MWCSPDNHTCSFVSRPFVKRIGRHQAAPVFHRVTECGQRYCGFRSRVDHARSARSIFRPRRNQSPSHLRELSRGLSGILSDNRNRLGRSDIVPRYPVLGIGDRVEVFRYDLLPARESIAATHSSNYVRSRLRMVSGVSSEAMANRRGNPNWFSSLQPIPILVTEFELQVEKLGLTREEYITSSELQRWCYHNRNRCYVPEWLLDEWKMQVDAIFSGVA